MSTRHPTLFDPETASKARRRLVRLDPRIAKVVQEVGPVRLARPAPGGAFAYLVRVVIFQQIALSAARAIHARLCAQLGDARGRITPQALLDGGKTALTASGVSRPKQRTLLSLAGAVDRGALVPRSLSRCPDDEIVEKITALHGFGHWSAHVFMLFHLGRLDAWPGSDLALRQMLAELHGSASPWSERDACRHAERWRPVRSAAAWSLWHYRKKSAPGLR